MKSDWTTTSLAELTEEGSPITYGVVKPGKEGSIVFIRGGDLADGRVLDTQLRTITTEVSEQYRRTLLRGGELLISLVGNPGQVAVVPPALIGANIARQVGLIRLRDETSAEFVRYFLESPDGRASLGTQTGGSVQQVINLRDLRTVPIPNPPLVEQRRIVRILDEAFEGIAKAKANGEKNLQNARALFESYLDSIFTQPHVGWEQRPLSELCEFRGGGTPSKSVDRYWQGKIPWVSPKDMKSEVVSDSMDHISKEAIEASATSLIPQGAILIVVRSGILARTVPLAVTGRELTINQDLKALCPTKMVESRFLYCLLESKMPVLLSMVSRGATVHRIITDQIRSLVCPVPSKKQQLAIVEKVDSLREETRNLESVYQQKLSALEELKRALLHDAFTGAL